MQASAPSEAAKKALKPTVTDEHRPLFAKENDSFGLYSLEKGPKQVEY